MLGRHGCAWSLKKGWEGAFVELGLAQFPALEEILAGLIEGAVEQSEEGQRLGVRIFFCSCDTGPRTFTPWRIVSTETMVGRVDEEVLLVERMCPPQTST